MVSIDILALEAYEVGILADTMQEPINATTAANTKRRQFAAHTFLTENSTFMFIYKPIFILSTDVIYLHIVHIFQLNTISCFLFLQTSITVLQIKPKSKYTIR